MTASSPLRRFLIAAAWVGAAVIVTTLVLHHMLTMPAGRGVNDSYIYLRATSDFVSAPSHLYDNAHHQVQSSFAAVAFVHPPSGLLPYLPLVPFVRLAGMPVAASVWSAIDTLALLAAIVLTGRRVGLSWLTLGAATMFISITTPLGSEIAQGQDNGLVLLLLVISMVRIPRLDSGLFMGLALAVKPVTGLILLVPLLGRQPRIAVAAVVTLAAVNLAFMPLIGASSALFYLDRVLPFFAGYTLRNGSNVSLAFALQTWFGGRIAGHSPFATPIPRALDAVVLLWTARIAVVLLWFRAAIDRRVDVTVVVAITLMTVPFLSSTIWPHYLVYLYPLVLIALAAPQLWIRIGGLASLVGLLWTGRGEGLWVGIAVLCVTAVALVASQAGWRILLPGRRAQPRLRPGL